MKKTYIEPMMEVVAVKCAKMIAASGTLSGEGVNMRIVNDGDGASSAAEGRSSNSLWDDEE